MFSTIQNVILGLCCCISLVVGPPPSNSGPSPYSRDLEEALRTEIFDTNSYQVLQRPSERVSVEVSLSLLTINELNIRDQTLSVTGFFTFYWMDDRLAWQSDTTYSNIRFLFSTESYVWRPPLIIENSVEDVSVISDKNVPMRFDSVGRVTWNPAGIYKVACEADTRYYPMDIQTCMISVSTWAYTEREIRLKFKSDPFDLTFYSPNGEWELISKETILPEAVARGGQSFSGLDFQIQLRRRPMFHILNTLFPVALMAILSAMVFKLPADSGEKIGFSLTILLAYTVYLTLISENIPSTSVTVCYLSVYLALTLSLGSLSVLCTIVVLNIYHRSDEEEPIPVWLVTVTLKILVRITCHKGYCCCSSGAKNNQVYPVEKEIVTPATVTMETDISTPKNSNTKRTSKKTEDEIPLEPRTSNTTEVIPVSTEQLTWKEVSYILDRLFFMLFMFIIIGSTALLFYAILGEWLSSTTTITETADL